MTKINHEPTDDLAEGRWWLKRAAQLFASEDVGSTQAYTAAVIGNGFIGLAHTTSSLASMAEVSQVRSAILTMSDEPETTLGEAIEREKRAAAEARPHDDEPTDGTVFVVEAAQVGAIFATTTDARARTWIRDEGAPTYGADNLGITALAVDRG